MTDIDKFIQFFHSMGIVCGCHERHCDKIEGEEEPEEAAYGIHVSQAIFLFDKDKNYIGVLDDEMGNYRSRKIIQREDLGIKEDDPNERCR